MNDADTVAALTSGVPLWHRLAAKLVLAPLLRWTAGALTLSLPDGTVREFGDPSQAARVTVVVKDWKFFWRVLVAADIGIGESYMEGEWQCSDLVELCRCFVGDQSMLECRSLWTQPTRWWHTLLRRARANTLAGSRRNIRYHYDLSNDLYRLFLDDSMTYSCGIFEAPETSLAEAQQKKIEGICQRLQLAPGHEVLEIGSGWGAFAIHAARRYGCRVTSLTLSDEQLRLARERVAAAGVASSVDIRLCDYRQMTGRFDRLVSIEMFEAVGYEHYGAFFGQCSQLLKPDGRMFLQTITMRDQRFDDYRRDFDWIRKYIFPGSLLASVAAMVRAVQQYTDLRIEWMQDIGPHYVRTLRCWRERFLRHLPAVRALGFDERFIRMWEFYLASCEAGFSTRYIGDVQMELAKPAA